MGVIGGGRSFVHRADVFALRSSDEDDGNINVCAAEIESHKPLFDVDNLIRILPPQSAV